MGFLGIGGTVSGREAAVAGSKIKVKVLLGSPGLLDRQVNYLSLDSMLEFSRFLGRKKLAAKSFPEYFLDEAVKAVIAALEANHRYVTSGEMTILVKMEPRSVAAEFFGSPLHAWATYLSDESSPGLATIRFSPDKSFLKRFIENESVLEQLFVHELQHHADVAFSVIGDAVSKRSKELLEGRRLSYGGWIAMLEILEIRNEGLAAFASLPTSSSGVATGIFCFFFQSAREFTGMFEKIPRMSREQLSQQHKAFFHVRDYLVGATMATTILARRLLAKGVKAYIKPEGGNEWFPIDRIREHYGTGRLYMTALQKQGNSISPEAIGQFQATILEGKEIIAELQGHSHLKFLSEYEEACRELGVAPIMSREIYNAVKLECHRNFIGMLHKAGIPPDAALR